MLADDSLWQPVWEWEQGYPGADAEEQPSWQAVLSKKQQQGTRRPDGAAIQG